MGNFGQQHAYMFVFVLPPRRLQATQVAMQMDSRMDIAAFCGVAEYS
jgi:hypothetical protein